MTFDQKQVSRLAKLNIADFETVVETEQAQSDLLRRLAQTSVKPSEYLGLMNCDYDRCGKDQCLEGCAFGSRGRRLYEILATHRLLKKAKGPVFEVRIVRGVWTRPFGALHKASIAAAKQLNRRALDGLNDPKIVAVGTFKVSVAPEYMGELWLCEIHQLVTGASEEDLQRVFCSTKPVRGSVNFDRVREVDNLGQTISNVLKRNLQGWQHPYLEAGTVARPKKAQRVEYYQWAFSLKLGVRMIRYGCDRYFNQLQKQERPLHLKPKKKRPYPVWLRRFMFGVGTRWENIDPHSQTYVKTGWLSPRERAKIRYAEPGPDYFAEFSGKKK